MERELARALSMEVLSQCSVLAATGLFSRALLTCASPFRSISAFVDSKPSRALCIHPKCKFESNSLLPEISQQLLNIQKIKPKVLTLLALGTCPHSPRPTLVPKTWVVALPLYLQGSKSSWRLFSSKVLSSFSRGNRAG